MRTSTDPLMAEALLEVAAGNRGAAVQRCAQASEIDPGARLPKALASFLSDAGCLGEGGDDGRQHIYGQPTAFEAFIDGGDNPNLYAATIMALQSLGEPASLLDIGCGDGRVTRSTIGAKTRSVHLVEPSTAMLEIAQTRVAAITGTPTVTITNAGVETLAGNAGDDQHWARGQATFVLHNLHPEVRPTVMTWLAAIAETIAVVEFDVPAFADRSEQHAVYAAERYERGLAQYPLHSPVSAGFLMPVLLGQFDPAATRHTWEQPVSRWREELSNAGFESIQSEAIHDYWWATAHLVTGLSG